MTEAGRAKSPERTAAGNSPDHSESAELTLIAICVLLIYQEMKS